MGNDTWSKCSNYGQSAVDAAVRYDVDSANPALPWRMNRQVGAAEKKNKFTSEIFLFSASAGEITENRTEQCDIFLFGRAGSLCLETAS